MLAIFLDVDDNEADERDDIQETTEDHDVSNAS